MSRSDRDGGAQVPRRDERCERILRMALWLVLSGFGARGPRQDCVQKSARGTLTGKLWSPEWRISSL
jgi:hypothetical protein